MWDATAKIPSGLLRGNTNQFGDFDLCTEIRTKVKLKDEKSVKVKGKYCMANIDVRASDEELKLVVHLMQGRNLLRSRLEDVSVCSNLPNKIQFKKNLVYLSSLDTFYHDFRH